MAFAFVVESYISKKNVGLILMLWKNTGERVIFGLIGILIYPARKSVKF